MGKGKIR